MCKDEDDEDKGDFEEVHDEFMLSDSSEQDSSEEENMEVN